MGLAQDYIQSHSPQLKIDFNPQSDEIIYSQGIQMQSKSLQLNTKKLLSFKKLLTTVSLKNSAIGNAINYAIHILMPQLVRVETPASPGQSRKLFLPPQKQQKPE